MSVSLRFAADFAFVKIPHADAGPQLSVLKGFTRIYFTTMPYIQTHQELLVHLAANGDPSAFYTLAAPSGLVTYKSLRNSGKSHTEAMTIIVPFLKKIHNKFLTNAVQEPFETWFDSQRKKYLSGQNGPFDESVQEEILEKIPHIEITHFESQMKLVFQRNYSRLRHTGKPSPFSRLVKSPNTFPGLKIILLFLCIILVLAAIHVSMTMIPIDVSVTLSAAGSKHTVSIPGIINRRLFKTPAMHDPVNNAMQEPIFSVKPDTILKPVPADTLTRLIAKKQAMPQITPKPAPSLTKVPSHDPLQANQPAVDTLASRPAIQGQSPQSRIPAPVDKIAAPAAGTSSFPTPQKKQQLISPDTSIYYP